MRSRRASHGIAQPLNCGVSRHGTRMAFSQSYEGTCHCRSVGFVYRTALGPEEWPIRACQCTFCRTHAALSTSDPRGSLEFFEQVPAALNRYRFGLKTADFLTCRNCGAYIGAMMRSGSKGFGIINIRVLQSVLDRVQEAQPMDAHRNRLATRCGGWSWISCQGT